MIRFSMAPTLGFIGILLFGIAPNAFTSEVKLLNHPQKSISVKNNTLFPEGITYNPETDHFILGSFRQGAIFEVDMQGNAKKIIEDKRLHSVFAVRIDSKHNRLLALTSDLGASIETSAETIKRYAALAVYDLTSGNPIHFIDLSKIIPESAHLVNGMAIDDLGNAYITDSFAAAIYKVDVNGNASLFLQDDEFVGEGINLNGIVYHPDGYLLAIKKSNGVLYKIPRSAPERFQSVKADRTYIGADGLILATNNDIVIIANRALGHNLDSAFAISSKDNWQSLRTENEYAFGNVYPTTGVIKNGEIFAVHSKLNTLVAAKAEEKSKLRQNATIEKIGVIVGNEAE